MRGEKAASAYAEPFDMNILIGNLSKDQ